ncbi:copper amine oxidase N-terminal domain-containing protein [Paenibacillus daejeonensis]|uniref:copper amine oxidase N-terminal domain-containing protein n=1 Tax=Paenibacillus daejeonensis TaxID=135193 RepID=UPI00036F7B22|nr:copper amine oxidase N-terminal domain-containing protein [Paenibacillus daejeonensis]
MRKTWKTSMVAWGLVAVLTVTGPTAGLASTSSIAITKQGQAVQSEQPPIIEQDRVLVPVRVISETLGFPVHWDASSRAVIVGGQPLSLDVEPRIIAGRAMVPIRAISEQLGAQITWKADTREVVLDVDFKRVLGDAVADIERFIAWAETEYLVTPGTEPIAPEDMDTEAINRFIRDQYTTLTESRRAIERKAQLLRGFYAEELPANTSLTIVIDWLDQAAEAMRFNLNKIFVVLTHDDAIEILTEAATELEISILLADRG